MSDKCVKCGEYVFGDVKLIGSYHTYLCAKHRNEWHEFIANSPEWAAVDSADARLQAAYHTGNEERAVELIKKLRAVYWEMYKTARAWATDDESDEEE